MIFCMKKLYFQGVVTAAVSLIETLAKKTPDEYKGCVSLAVSRLSRVSVCHAIYPLGTILKQSISVFRGKFLFVDCDVFIHRPARLHILLRTSTLALS